MRWLMRWYWEDFASRKVGMGGCRGNQAEVRFGRCQLGVHMRKSRIQHLYALSFWCGMFLILNEKGIFLILVWELFDLRSNLMILFWALFLRNGLFFCITKKDPVSSLRKVFNCNLGTENIVSQCFKLGLLWTEPCANLWVQNSMCDFWRTKWSPLSKNFSKHSCVSLRSLICVRLMALLIDETTCCMWWSGASVDQRGTSTFSQKLFSTQSSPLHPFLRLIDLQYSLPRALSLWFSFLMTEPAYVHRFSSVFAEFSGH